MYLTIHNAHNGMTSSIPKPIRFQTLQSFKEYLVESFTNYTLDGPNNVFLLTQFGMRVDFNIINELTDIYFYDKRLFVNDNPSILRNYAQQSKKEVPSPSHPQLPPYSRKLSIRQMSSNLRSNTGWSMSIKVDATSAEEQVRALKRQISVMFRCLSIIFEFIATFTTDIEKSFTKYYDHINQLSMKTLHTEWQDHYKNLKIMQSFTFKNGRAIKLSDIVDGQALSDASAYIEQHLPTLIERFNQLSTTINEVNEFRLLIDSRIQELRDDSIAEFAALKSLETLLADIKQIADAMTSDIETSITDESKGLGDIYSKHFASSKKLDEKYVYLFNDLTKLDTFKTKLAEQSTSLFKSCANLQMQMVSVKVALNEFDFRKQDEKHNEAMYKVSEIKRNEEYLSLAIDMPLLFGFAIIEKRRQFEWYDFFASGIVNNVTEQLQLIINQERVFRKLWAKRIGSFLSILHSLPGTESQTLPSLDVTVVKGREDFFGQFWINEIEREDIDNYIKWVRDAVKNNGREFSTLLERNFEDLIKSTNAMKHVIKSVGMLSSYTSPENIDIQQLQERKEDYDMIQGYKNRIRKLENLLHQQQFKDLSTWPVIKGTSQDRSTILNPKRSVSYNDTNVIRHDGKYLLDTRSSSFSKIPRHNSHADEGLAHENEVLKQQIEKLQGDLQSTQKPKLPFEAEVSGAKVLAQQNNEILSQKRDLEKKIEEQTRLISELKNESAQKDDEIFSLKKQMLDADSRLDELSEKNKALESSRKADNNIIERELLEEKKKSEDLSEEISKLKITIQTEIESDQVLSELTAVAGDLLDKLVAHTRITYDYVLTFSFILEKMGLLLTTDSDGGNQLRIRRVKGLRAKKHDDVTEHSTVVTNIKNLMKWSSSSLRNSSSDQRQAAKDIIKFYREDVDSAFEEYNRAVAFRSNVIIEQVSEHDIRTIEFFLNAVIKRFKDVEGLAKKLAKEKKLHETLLQTITKKMSSKVTISNFQTNDLVLFLPTRINSKETQEAIQPWTAFNIGSPHYFLKTQPSGDREWIVARISSIVEHTVTPQNLNDSSSNPYMLNEGITWYLVEAKEIN